MTPRGLLKHLPPNSAVFVGPHPIGPFANPMDFSKFYYYQPVTMEQFTANSKEVNRRKSSEEAACHQGCSQVCTCH